MVGSRTRHEQSDGRYSTLLSNPRASGSREWNPTAKLAGEASNLFLPGAAGSASFWQPVADLLRLNRPRHLLGWPGLGDKPPRPEIAGIDDLVAMVVDRLANAEGPSNLVAQSMGGVVAIRATLAAPDSVRRLVLTATSGGLPMADLGAVDRRPDYYSDFPLAAKWISESREDFGSLLGSVAHATLLLWGDADEISPPPVGRRLLKLMPDASLHVVAGGGHDLARTHAVELARLVDAHLV